MKTHINCPSCGEEIECPGAPARSLVDIATPVIYFFVFGAYGWTLLNSGSIFWGSVCLAAAVGAPVLHELTTAYQRNLPSMAREAKRKEIEQLIEIANAEKQSGSDLPHSTD